MTDRRADERILVSHTGNLARPPDVEAVWANERAVAAGVRIASLARRGHAA